MQPHDVIREIREHGPQTSLERQLLGAYSLPMAIIVGVGALIGAGLMGWMTYLMLTHG